MKKFYLIFILILSLILIFTFSQTSFAAYPKLVSTLNSAFETIEGWLIKISTPAAAVAIGVGILMKKFSFGDEERIVSGKKLIRSTLFSYAFILSVDLVLKAIESLFGK